jgi:hypothetical protein
MSGLGKRRIGFGMAALLLVAAGVFAWSHWRPSADLPAWQAESWLPAEAELVVWSDPVASVATRFDELAKTVTGLRGIWDAVQLASGVDWRDPQAIERAGLRGDAGLAAFWWRQAAWVVVPIAGARGGEHVLEQLRRRGYGVGKPQALRTGQLWRVAARDGQADQLLLWQGDQAVVLRLPLDGTPTGDVEAEMLAYLSAKTLPVIDKAAGVLHLRWSWQAAGAAQGAKAQAALHQALGPADLLIGGAIDRLQGLDADVLLGPDGLTAQVQLRAATGKLADIASYHAGFIDDAAALSLGDLLPDETLLLSHLRLNPALWNTLPQSIQDLALPAHALQALHPSLSGVDARQALQAWDGQVAVALLAVADSVPLDPRGWAKLWWRTALRPVVAVSLRSDTQARDLHERIRAAIDTSADRTQAVSFGKWVGYSVPGPDAPWLLLRQGRMIAMASGAGTADDLRRVVEGKYAPLSQAVRGEHEKTLVDGKRYWSGSLIHTPRLVRSLRRRGVPDYATQLIGAVHSVALTLEMSSDCLTLRLAMRPSMDEEADHAAPVQGAGGGL